MTPEVVRWIVRGQVLSDSDAERFCDVNGDTFCNIIDALIIARGQQGSDHEDQRCVPRVILTLVSIGFPIVSVKDPRLLQAFCKH